MTPDALVVGAGPAGLAAAIGLADWCRSVTVIDAGKRGRLRQAGEHVPPPAVASMAAEGFAALLEDPRHGESSGVSSLWGDEVTAHKEYFRSLPGRGVNLRREIFDDALSRAASRAGVSLRFCTRLLDLEPRQDGFRATLRGDRDRVSMDARIVVDASGRRAVAARRLGAGAQGLDRLVGGTACLQPAAAVAAPGRVYIESMPDGWWYAVRLPGAACVLSYMTDADVLQRHPGGARGLWRERLYASRLLAPFAGSEPDAARLQVFDAATQCVEPLAAPGFVAVGDAATAFDPLSSQGISKALCDGHRAALALAREARGETGAVARHARQRLREFGDYLGRRRDYYRAERRWQDSGFWRARQVLTGERTG